MRPVREDFGAKHAENSKRQDICRNAELHLQAVSKIPETAVPLLDCLATRLQYDGKPHNQMRTVASDKYPPSQIMAGVYSHRLPRYVSAAAKR